MQFKKNRAILSAVLAAAMASSTLLSVTASAAGTRTAAEKFGDSTYAERFMSLYDDVYTNGTKNGYRNKDGVPYHSVEELICEAPDYGHETTSEAMSYIVWIAAMHDNLVKDGVVSGASGSDLADAWKTLEALIPTKDQQPGLFDKTELSAQVAAEHPDDVKKYPSEGNSSNTGSNPLHGKFVSAYKSEGRDHLLHWLADVDDWYGFGGSARGEKGDLTFINTFQRGDQESCFETIPHPSIETLKYGASGKGMKFAFQESTSESWSYTNAPDAEDRAIQAVFAANRWGVGNSDVSSKAGMMGDFCRNDMYDKYYKEIGCQSMTAPSAGDKGKHYLMSWYTAWGGDGSSQHSWAWQIGCSHAHQFYQNPLAAFGLLYDSDLNKGMKADGATKDYETSLTRQLEMYLWLSSAEGPFAGGCTNCWMGDYETYPSGVPQFYKMAYIEQPVYADPGSNNWTGNQYWATQRLAELYYLVCQDSTYSSKGSDIKPGGMSIKEALKTVLDKWVEFFVSNIKLTDDGDFSVPSSLKWEGAPDDWSGSYSKNSGLHATVAGTQNTDLGCVCSLANTLIYYAAANGVKASEASASGELAQKALYDAKELLDRTWELSRDDIGLTRVDHNGSLARFWAQEVYTGGNTGKYPYGYEVGPGSTFIDIREMYKDPGQSYSDLYAELKAAYDKDVANGAKIKEFNGTYSYGMDCATNCDEFKEVAKVDLKYHRFWHAGDILMGLGTMAELYPEMSPVPGTTTESTTTTSSTTSETTTSSTSNTGVATDTDWGNVNESDGATPEARVDVADAVLLARFVAEDADATISAQGKKNADVNVSGAPDSEDTVKILKFIAKLIPYSDLGKKG
jgi:hypothetical protein